MKWEHIVIGIGIVVGAGPFLFLLALSFTIVRLEGRYTIPWVETRILWGAD